VVWFVAAACGDSKPAPPAPPPTPTPTAPVPQPPAPQPLTVREVFGLPFGTTVMGIRVDAVEGPCRGGLEYRHTSVTSKHRSIDVWSYAMGSPAGVTCDPFTSKTIPVLFRAVEQLAGLGTGPIAIDLNLGSQPEVVQQRYFEAIGQLPPEADEAVVAKRIFDRQVFSHWHPFIGSLGYQVTSIELFMLEPVRDFKGPVPPRVPRRVTLVIEPNGPIVTRGDRTVKPRTMQAVFAIPFEVKIDSIELRADVGTCMPVAGVGNRSVRIGIDPDTCALTQAHMEQELPALYLAGAELIGRAEKSEVVMGTRFSVLPVMEKWIPAGRGKPREKDYKKLTARMREAKIFAHLDPFISAIGLTLTDISIEKLSSESGAALLQAHPSLASTGLTAKDVIPVPMMTALVLAP
jgi:hypothetical protein